MQRAQCVLGVRTGCTGAGALCWVLTGLCAGASALTMLQKEQRQPQESVLEDSARSQHCSAHLHPVRAAPPGVCWRGHTGGP